MAERAHDRRRNLARRHQRTQLDQPCTVGECAGQLMAGRDRQPRLADGVVGKVVNVHEFGLVLRLPLASSVLEVADQLLLLGVHRDHRLAAPLEGPHRAVDVLELGVAVGVLLALFARGFLQERFTRGDLALKAGATGAVVAGIVVISIS